MDINRHKLFLISILKDIYTDAELAPLLGFKGGTALMFFYNLPRFSVDLDFNLIKREKEELVYEKIRLILLKYGKIYDEALKHYGPILVLDYEAGERKLKLEISNRSFDDHYDIKNLLGINMKVMQIADMFAHKLCALTDRGQTISRDVFDAWFFMNRRTPLNVSLIESRMKMPYQDFMQDCISRVTDVKQNRILQGLGELMDNEMKTFVRNKLKNETISLLKFYKEFPITT